MEVHTIIGFGIAVSVPVWLAVEEIVRRRAQRTMTRIERRARIPGERHTPRPFKRAPVMSREAVSRLGVAARS